MSDNDAIATAITAAATAAGAIVPEDIVPFIKTADVRFTGGGMVTNAGELVEAMRAAKPHFFNKRVHEMTGAEFVAAKRQTIADTAKHRNQADEARAVAKLTSKYSQRTNP